MNFLLAYPATLAAKRERLIIFRCVIGKKKVAKKKKITTDGVNRIPTIALQKIFVINTRQFYCKNIARKENTNTFLLLLQLIL